MTMHANLRLALVLALSTALLPACEVPEDELGALSLAEENEPIEEPMPEEQIPPPRVPADPRVPRRAGLKTLVLDFGLVVPYLAGTRLSFDATQNAEPVYQGTEQTGCARPDGYWRAFNACRGLSTTRRIRCERAADANFPIACNTTPKAHYSYIAFSDRLKAESPELVDKVFDFGPIQRSPWVGDLTIVINQVGATLDANNVSLGFHVDRWRRTNLVVHVQPTSPIPTAYCYRNGIIGCPNVMLNDMDVGFGLTGLQPTADKQGIEATGAHATFNFNRDVNNFPEWLTGALHDIDPKIHEKVEGKLRAALFERRKELSVALTKVVLKLARVSSSFRGWKAIDEVVAHDGRLIVHYESL